MHELRYTNRFLRNLGVLVALALVAQGASYAFAQSGGPVNGYLLVSAIGAALAAWVRDRPSTVLAEGVVVVRSLSRTRRFALSDLRSAEVHPTFAGLIRQPALFLDQKDGEVVDLSRLGISALPFGKGPQRLRAFAGGVMGSLRP